MASFLEEQLKRIREMTEQMSRLADQTSTLSQEIARDRELLRNGPLQAVRDLRTFRAYEERSASNEASTPRSTSHDAPRRRRRR